MREILNKLRNKELDILLPNILLDYHLVRTAILY